MPKRRIERSAAEEEQFQLLKRQKKAIQQRAYRQKIRNEKRNVVNNVVTEQNDNICTQETLKETSQITS